MSVPMPPSNAEEKTRSLVVVAEGSGVGCTSDPIWEFGHWVLGCVEVGWNLLLPVVENRECGCSCVEQNQVTVS